MGLGKEQQSVSCELSNSQNSRKVGRYLVATNQSGKTMLNSQCV